MNQKKEVTFTKHIMVIASIILNDEKESEKVVKIGALIKDGALDLSTKISLFSGQTCLHLTVEKNLILVARLLIHSGADINATDWQKKTPLHNAVRYGLDKMVILFYQANLDACGGNRLETPLHIAVRKNYPACVEVLMSIARPANSLMENIDNKTPMDLIEELSDEQSKKALAKAFVPSMQPKGLYTAIATKNWTAVFEYINLGLPVSVTYANQSSAIIQAAENGLADILLLLCKQPDIDINATDEQGETALHKSIRYKHIDCIKILVTALKPVNRNTRNKLGKTAGDLLVELHNLVDQNALREALVYLPPKKRIPDYETNFFASCDTKIFSVKPYSWFTANFKYLELDKLYNYKTLSTAITGNDTEQDEKKLHKLLLYYGLEPSYPESEVSIFCKAYFQKMAPNSTGGDTPASVLCLQAVFNLCAGEKINKQLQINIQDIYASTLGLLSLHEPLEIIRSLILLSSKFCNHQHLIGNLLVKNIIISSFEFGYDLTEKRLDETLRLYLKNYCLNDISQTHLNYFESGN